MLPQYEISGFLGRGGMGAVYRAKQIRLDREVAIKVLPETLTQGGDDEMKFAERFELEAQAMAKFNHPSIVAVFDFGETSEGQLFFVMEFVEGMDIHQYLRENGGSISQEYALSITAHVLDALEYAHARGIVHRDIKPANILLNNEGQVKIADFGLAKLLTDGDDYDKPALTMTNVALGTPDFVAPEAIDGDGVPDHRADLYAVGVMLYQMLTGKIPRGQFPSPSELLPDLDPRVDDIVEQSMQSDPADRYASASSMRMDLDPVISAPMSRISKTEESAPPDKVNKTASVSVAPKTKKNGRPLKLYMIATICAFVATLIFVLGGPSSKKDIPPLDATPAKPAETPDDRPTPLQKAEEVKGATPFPVSRTAIQDNSDKSPSSVEPSTANEASVESPFENTLGMKFVPVPIAGGPSDGKLILFSLWETRVSDYRAFTDANPSIATGTLRFPQDDSHPAVYNITYENAVAFCEWLTRSEKEKGNPADGQHYRLPTDHEWSCAIGIGEMEDPMATPASKDKAIERLWPWGGTWPPPNGTINCYGEENAGLGLYDKPKDHLKGYSDEFRFTAPVDSMGAGQFGLYHMSGNVSEWTSDWSDETKTRRTTRSSGWMNVPGGFFMSSARGFPVSSASGDSLGLRVVLDLNQDAPENGPGTAARSAPQNSMKTPDSAPATAMPETAAASPLASVPGLEAQLVAYLHYRQTLIGDLSDKYLGALEGRFDAAISAGDLTLATAFESEKKAVSGLRESLLELDKDPFASISSSSTLAPLLEASPEGLVDLRAIWTNERRKITSQLSSKLVQSLNELEVQLTKEADLENALKVKTLKDSIGNTQKPATVPEPPESAMPAPTVDAFENSLGMKFLPAEVAGSPILLSVYETTVDNYRRFLRDNRDIQWPEPDYRLRDEQAATLMSWHDAVAFCEWLTKEERQNGTIGENDQYTLPSLLELQSATGIVQSYDVSADRTTYSTKYLWGDEWPIPRIVGNLYGEEDLENASARKPPITGYNDGEINIAAVGSYEPNQFGFHDLIGNAGEWCRDWFNEDEVAKAIYGGNWGSNGEVSLRAGFRFPTEPAMRSKFSGFRVVLRRSSEHP